MIVIDTNILIYIAKGELGREDFDDEELAYSVISSIEARGFSSITTYELRAIEAMLDNATLLPMHDDVVECTVRIRQGKRIKLGDAIIAATALEYGLPLWTASTKDFSGIANLRLHNPLIR